LTLTMGASFCRGQPGWLSAKDGSRSHWDLLVIQAGTTAAGPCGTNSNVNEWQIHPAPEGFFHFSAISSPCSVSMVSRRETIMDYSIIYACQQTNSQPLGRIFAAPAAACAKAAGRWRTNAGPAGVFTLVGIRAASRRAGSAIPVR
jgi:hypothetical protein